VRQFLTVAGVLAATVSALTTTAFIALIHTLGGIH